MVFLFQDCKWRFLVTMTKTKEIYVHDKNVDTSIFEYTPHLTTVLEGFNSLRDKGELLDITLVIGTYSYTWIDLI